MATEDHASSSTGLRKKVEEAKVKYLLPVLSSFSSDCRGCMIPARSANSLQKNGFGIFAVDHYKMGFQDPELYGIPDVDTLIPLPWKPEVGWLACNLHNKGGLPNPQCPRQKLIELQDKARALGFVMKSGVEPEFILLSKENHTLAGGEYPEDLRVYHHPQQLLQRMDFVGELVDTMEMLGWEPYQAEHEAVAGQYEINFGYIDALTMADRHLFMKMMIKELALKHDCRATFMPAPFPGKVMGSGLHLNVSLWSPDTNNNLFPDAKNDTGLSDMAEHFMAGVLKHALGLTAILCPSINSYRRLHATTLCGDPTVSWGNETRYPMIRIPTNDRIELRWGDGSVNPYLLQAAVLAAGIDGIENKIPLDRKLRIEEDMTGKLPPKHLSVLPKTLADATAELEKDEVLKKYLGAEIVEGFAHMKKKQLSEFNKLITPFEVEIADEY